MGVWGVYIFHEAARGDLYDFEVIVRNVRFSLFVDGCSLQLLRAQLLRLQLMRVQ